MILFFRPRFVERCAALRCSVWVCEMRWCVGQGVASTELVVVVVAEKFLAGAEGLKHAVQWMQAALDVSVQWAHNT